MIITLPTSKEFKSPNYLGFSLGASMSIIANLATHLNKTEDEVKRYLRFAPNKYKVYHIPKRSHGKRTIAQPARELKDYQRAFLSCYTFPVHPAAKAYQQNLSIKDNALVHKNNPYLLKTDLENFFNSITPYIFWKAVEEHAALKLSFEEDDHVWINRLLFWCPSKKPTGKLILSIGAPTSPHISNFCLSLFDHCLMQFCKQNSIAYSRYADDLTFSTRVPGLLTRIMPKVQEILRDCFGDALQINHRKTVLSSKAHNRHVTGVTINNQNELSLGRDRKRFIKHLVHQYLLKKLSSTDIQYLCGLLSFAQHIEPVFIRSLHQKYSEQVIQSLIRMGHEK